MEHFYKEGGLSPEERERVKDVLMNVDEGMIRHISWCDDESGCQEFWQMIGGEEPDIPRSSMDTIIEHLMDYADRRYYFFGRADQGGGITTKTGVNYTTLENLIKDIRGESTSPGPEGVLAGGSLRKNRRSRKRRTRKRISSKRRTSKRRTRKRRTSKRKKKFTKKRYRRRRS